MDLEGNFILGGGTVHLAKVLKDNVYLTHLVMYSFIPEVQNEQHKNIQYLNTLNDS